MRSLCCFEAFLQCHIYTYIWANETHKGERMTKRVVYIISYASSYVICIYYLNLFFFSALRYPLSFYHIFIPLLYIIIEWLPVFRSLSIYLSGFSHCLLFIAPLFICRCDDSLTTAPASQPRYTPNQHTTNALWTETFSALNRSPMVGRTSSFVRAAVDNKHTPDGDREIVVAQNTHTHTNRHICECVPTNTTNW